MLSGKAMYRNTEFVLENLATLLRTTRQHRLMSLQDVARATGLCKSTLMRVESGQSNGEAHTALVLVRWLRSG